MHIHSGMEQLRGMSSLLKTAKWLKEEASGNSYRSKIKRTALINHTDLYDLES